MRDCHCDGFVVDVPSCCPTYRDDESAFMSMNGKTCFIKKKLNGVDGAQLCGGIFKEQVFRVRGCKITLTTDMPTVPLTVRVWTNLDGKADDESFGVDDIIISKFEEEGSSRNI